MKEKITQGSEVLSLMANIPNLFEEMYRIKAHDEIMDYLEDDLLSLADMMFKIPSKFGHFSVTDAVLRDKGMRDLGLGAVVTNYKTPLVEKQIRDANEYQSTTSAKARIHDWLNEKIGYELEKVSAEITMAISKDVEAPLGAILEKRDSLLTRSNKSQWVSFKEAYLKPEDVEEYKTFRLGIPSVDDQLSDGRGFRTGNIMIMAGSPGSGKTSLLHQFIIENTLENDRCLFFSLENRWTELRYMFEDYFVGAEIPEPKRSEIQMDFADNIYDINDICKTIRAHKQRNPNLSIVAIDYAQLIQDRELKNPTLYTRLESASNKLQQLKELNILIVVLSQIDKDSLKTNSKGEAQTLTHSNLKGGSLSESCTYCIILQSDAINSESEAQKNKSVKMHLTKNRHGSPMSVETIFAGNKRSFREVR